MNYFIEKLWVNQAHNYDTLVARMHLVDILDANEDLETPIHFLH